MATTAASERSRFADLKAKQRQIRSGFPDNVGLRIHRAISWLGRAEAAEEDYDAAFIFYWISFNAAYADDRGVVPETGERSNFAGFFDKLIELDGEHQIYGEIWNRFPSAIRVLLNNKFVFQPFWAFQNGVPSYEDWEERFEGSKRRLNSALQSRETKLVLSTLFDRLYVLRNQLIHGGATWNSGVNRGQVRDGAQILSFLVPIFIDIMMDHPDKDWGAPFYPVVEG